MSYNLGTAQGTIRLEYDSRGVLRARDDLGRFVSLSNAFGDDVERDTDRAGKGWKGFALHLGTAAKYMGIAALAANVLQNAIVGIVGVTQTLMPIIIAGLATLPGIIFGAVSAFVVFKAAIAGVGDALKAAAEQDADKFAEAIKKLAPEAQAAGVELRQLIHGMYRVLYTVETNMVTIHAVRHGARRPLRPDELPGHE